MMRRISAKKLASLGGKVPWSSITGKRKAIRKVSAKQRGKIKARRTIRERWWAEGKRTCGICGKPILTFEEMVNDHITPGSGKDDSEGNQQPAHGICNLIKGSRRNFTISGGQDGN
jgi:5-methylcytosine-specific restriction endonuclease McrA